MAIKLKKIERPNPLDRTTSKYYLVQEKSGTVKLNDIATEIASRSSLTLGDVQSVLSNLMQILPFFFSLGQTIHLDGFGTFRVTIGSEGSDTPEELTVHNVRSKKIVFLPSTELKRSLDKLSFEIEKQ
jgi:predicted histone-like DNA-binding protein